MISCQLALYPLATKEFAKVIVEALKALEPLQKEGLIIEVGSMSTVIKGKDDLVWKAVRLLFEEAAKDGQQIVLTASISNECGCDL
ncbi:YkoF family thiamine/hydroxymethylpyrimidine-binding protein [Tepidibacillus sp. LV47]|uniref:YkoF family thiamine/hydroxymethylpyrimidine-binding protein n=1 Tax=Tepidibacillus sp. LV47 TaxID=3398228 RepID=UPI003AAA7E02